MARAGDLRSTRAAGFMLTEMLVSLFVFGLIATLILSVLSMQQRAEGSLRERTDKDDGVIAAQTMLRERMDAMRAVGDIRGAGDSLRLFGTPTQLDFVAPIYQSEGPHALHHFRLRLAKDGGLMLYSASDRSFVNPTLQDIEGWNALRLIGNVVRIQLTYFGQDRFSGHDAWQERWQQRRSLPKLIRVQLSFAQGDPQVWPVLMVSPAPQTKIACHDDQKGADCGDAS